MIGLDRVKPGGLALDNGAHETDQFERRLGVVDLAAEQSHAAAIALGLIEALGAGYLSSAYKDVFAFVVLLAALVFLPNGLAGRRAATERV